MKLFGNSSTDRVIETVPQPLIFWSPITIDTASSDVGSSELFSDWMKPDMKPFLLMLALLPAGCALPPGYVWGLPTAYEPPHPVVVARSPTVSPETEPARDPAQEQRNIDALLANGGAARSLRLQRHHDNIDWYNQQTGTVTQCIGARCW